MALRKKRNTTSFRNNRIVQFFFQQKVLPFTLSFIVLAILFVGFRMRGVEQAYQFSHMNQELDKVEMRNKELRAQRARAMSVPRLREFAVRYNLKDPGPEQIILIP